MRASFPVPVFCPPTVSKNLHSASSTFLHRDQQEDPAQYVTRAQARNTHLKNLLNVYLLCDLCYELHLEPSPKGETAAKLASNVLTVKYSKNKVFESHL